ncbi:formin-like protein 18 isoform X1 [Octopus sinensis]|uniref:Formin-like protein 18 isoform X1 n=1 Tax=Octopus sinensis TaxID=2607531 RepID=A0A6P7T7A3_9MOLL|nr:formin-like protein 18 isoform X1 [Octopus sinensis]
MCPICNVKELKLNSDGTRTNQNVCKDCQELTCDDCGEYSESLSTKLQEWVCHLCRKRRVLVLSTGLWYHGRHRNPDSIILQVIESQCLLEKSSQITQQIPSSPPKQGETEEKSTPKPDVQQQTASQQPTPPPPTATTSSSNEATGGAEAGVIVSQPPLPPPRRKLRKAHSTNQTTLPSKESDVSGKATAEVHSSGSSSSKVPPTPKPKPLSKSVKHAHSVPAPTDKGRQVHSAATSTAAQQQEEMYHQQQ